MCHLFFFFVINTWCPEPAYLWLKIKILTYAGKVENFAWNVGSHVASKFFFVFLKREKKSYPMFIGFGIAGRWAIPLIPVYFNSNGTRKLTYILELNICYINKRRLLPKLVKLQQKFNVTQYFASICPLFRVLPFFVAPRSFFQQRLESTRSSEH